MSDPSTAAHPGELLGGRYRLGGLLGVGGSASVFEAEDLMPAGSAPESVAVKILHPHLSIDERSREAFFREARAAQSIAHPNIVSVRAHGLHEAGGVTMGWIAFDLVRGLSAAEWVATRGPMHPLVAVTVISGVLAALTAAHTQGLVHRDVSPANVLLEADETEMTVAQVRLVDFGLADVTGRPTLGTDVLLAADDTDAREDTVERDELGVIGNALYMSPEQALGKAVRASGDIYQTGAVLYFLLTGRPPFPRATTRQVLEAHVTAPPPVPSAVAAVPRALDRVVTTAMNKTPVRRYRNAEEFRFALIEASASIPARVEPPADPGAVDETDPATGATLLLPRGDATSVDYLDAPQVGPKDAATLTRTSGAGLLVAIAAMVLIGGSVVWGVVTRSSPVAGDGQRSPSAEALPSETSAPEPTSTPEPPPIIAPIVDLSVPALIGSLADAERVLRESGLVLGQVTRIESAEGVDRVLSQHPGAGSTLPPGSGVDVTIANGSNTVPHVAGLDVATATALLESAGFTVVAPPATSTADVVTASRPASGAVLKHGIAVSLVVAEPTPTPTPTPASASASGESGARRR
ncbi:protein kinase domain-containing protein [Agromyces badenianii]|uniref:protein kinase domain-containing protein n=1 Tax=Agromyces badenianii TaxID=2080742 RepID=UPI000D5911A4|nr:PASTA domain-containing protein [Agromyces badenianii]PWC04316.1 hypothetical protein DCE94_09205 [Agromyces badenianii]